MNKGEKAVWMGRDRSTIRLVTNPHTCPYDDPQFPRLSQGRRDHSLGHHPNCRPQPDLGLPAFTEAKVEVGTAIALWPRAILRRRWAACGLSLHLLYEVECLMQKAVLLLPGCTTPFRSQRP